MFLLVAIEQRKGGRTMADFEGTRLCFADIYNLGELEKSLRLLECRHCLSIPKLYIRDKTIFDFEEFQVIKHVREYKLSCGCEFSTVWTQDSALLRRLWNELVAES